MLYAVASTGALATGTYCPITDCDDRDRKWYLHLWRELSDAVSEAADAADTAGDDDADLLDKFNWWVGAICIRLAAEYGLTKWRLCNG